MKNRQLNSKRRSMERLLAQILFLVLILSTPTFAANEIRLKNGDRLSGKIVSKDEGSVVLETDYAGQITINMSFIEEIVETDSETSEISEDETEEESKDELSEEVNVVEAKEPVVSAAPSRRRLIGGERFIGLADGWEGNANVGFSYTTGNSRTSTMTTGIRGVKTGETDKLTVYARSLWNSNRNAALNTTTQNAVWGGLRYDRRIGDRLFGFGSYDFERDRPRRLNFRSVLGGGLGHHTIKSENTELDLIFGTAWNRTWQVGQNTDTPEGLAGNTLKHRFNGRLRFQQTFTFFQNMTDANEFRFILDATVTADLTRRIGLHFTVGDRFNNDPARNARKNDFLFTTGLRWNFGTRK
jgi:putative salt-induced outer membrane protein